MKLQPQLFSQSVRVGFARWRRWIPFHLVTAAGLAAAFALFVVALSLPGAVEAKNAILDHRTPAGIDGTFAATEPAAFAAVTYSDVYNDRTVDVVAVDVTNGPVATPEGPVLIQPGDVVASSSLASQLKDPASATTLLARINGARLTESLATADAAEPGELFAYVAVTSDQIATLCDCDLSDLGVSTFNLRGTRSTSSLDFGFVFLVALASALMLAVLYNSATLAAGLLAERERRLIGELSLLGAPRWVSSTTLLAGLAIDVALASTIGVLLARPLGTYLSQFPPIGYELPVRTLGYASVTTAVIAITCLAVICVIAVNKAGRGIGTTSTLSAVRTAGSDASGTNRGPLIGGMGIALLALSSALSKWADSHAMWIVIMLGVGVLATARGIMETPRLIRLISKRDRSGSNSPTSHLVHSQLNAPNRRFALEGVIAGLIIATGIITAYGTVSRGGDAITLGSSYDSLNSDTIVVTGATRAEANQLHELTNGQSVELQLVAARTPDNDRQFLVVGDCQALKTVVSTPDTFSCDNGRPVAIDQTLFSAATGMDPRPTPATGIDLTGLNYDDTDAGTITIGTFHNGAINLPGDIWLNGALTLVDPTALDFTVDPAENRWIYIPGSDTNVEQIRDFLAPSVRSDAQTAGQLATQGNRKQLDFFRSMTTLGGLILALVAGLALGMSALADFNRIQRSATAAMLLGAPRRIIASSLCTSAAIRMTAIVTAGSSAATVAGLSYIRLIRADEYGLTGPLYGFNWWLIAGVSTVALVAAVSVRYLVVRSAMRSVTTSVLR